MMVRHNSNLTPAFLIYTRVKCATLLVIMILDVAAINAGVAGCCTGLVMSFPGI